MSADLRTIRPEFKEILLNRNLIKLNQVRGEGIGADQAYVGQLEINSKRKKKRSYAFQDPLGVQAKRIIPGQNIDVYSRWDKVTENAYNYWLGNNK